MTKKTLATFVAVGLCLILVQTAGADIVPNGVSGRYIRVNKSKPNNLDSYFHIGEIVGRLGTGPDMAVSSKGASASTVHGSHVHGSDAALISGAASTGGDTWTYDDSSAGPPYQIEALVDLGQTRSLSELQVLQRGDCCGERLYDFTVTFETDATSGSGIVASQYFPGQAPSTTTMTLAVGQMIRPGGAGAIGTETVGPVPNGRFIKVQNNGTANRPLHTSEIEGFSSGLIPNNNAAPSTNDITPTSFESQQGSGGHGSTASVYDGNLETGSAVWTRNGVSNNYILDLGASQDVETIRVWQRADGCCQDRLSNFTVSLLADDGGNPGTVVASDSLAGNAPTNSFAEFTFPDSLTIGANDILKIEIDPMAGTADLLSVSGALTIEPGATLEVTVLSGSVSGDFNVLDFGTISGQFSSVSLAGLSPGYAWVTTDLYTTGTLTIVPEPVTMLALLGGLTGLGGYIRKRRRA